MSLEGKLIADFSSVPTEAEKAVRALGSMETGAAQVVKAFDHITVPPALRDLPPTGVTAKQAMDGLSGSLQQTDRVLAMSLAEPPATA